MHSPSITHHEQEILQRQARWGNRAALESLYRLHTTAIHALAFRWTSNQAAVEDITQDTFLKMLQFLNRLGDDAALRPWLKKVAANAAIDRLGRQRRYIAIEHEEDGARRSRRWWKVGPTALPQQATLAPLQVLLAAGR